MTHQHETISIRPQKKIFLTGNVLTTQRYGGISRYLVELALGISRSSNWTVRIGSILYTNEYLYAHRKALSHWGIHLRQYRGGMIDLNERLVDFSRRRLLDSANIIHETNYNFKRLQRDRCGRVSTFYDMMSEAIAPNESVREKKLKTARHSDALVAISESTKSEMVHHLGVAPEKIRVIHLASEVEPSSEPPISAAGRPYLLWVGTRQSYKNFSQFIVALSRSKRFRSDCLLVCAGGPELSVDELQLLSDHRIPVDRVIHCRPDDNELASLYTHVVASNRTSIPEITGDAALLIDPDDADSIAAAIDRICDDGTYRTEMIRRGIERAQCFSWKRCVDSHLKLYESLA